MMDNLSLKMQEYGDAVQATLDHLLPLGGDPEDRIVEAMRYAALGGGKRIRPFMVVASAEIFGVNWESALRAAAAIEMVHCYSLVHDDLPAMDDDDLRRGRPTCHIEFDEATAILAGDGLLTKAFEVLAHFDTHDDARVRSELVLALAQSAGDHGMVGGQILDLMAENTSLTIQEITRLQRLKTGMLFSVSCEMGAILGNAGDKARSALHAYAHDMGLAFQIADDLLDVEGDEEAVGKKLGKDADAGKETFVSLLGIERARAQADVLTQQAIDHLDMFGEKSQLLQSLARFVVDRKA